MALTQPQVCDCVRGEASTGKDLVFHRQKCVRAFEGKTLYL